MSRTEKSPIDRRGFLKGAAAAAAAVAGTSPFARAGQSEQITPGAQTTSSSSVQGETIERPGSDFMVDVIKTLNVEFLCANPSDSMACLQESIIHYGGNQKPEWITCVHEEASVAMANGYAKIECKPLIVCAHGTVGLQHAAMAIYNAYCDRAPVIVLLGNTLDAAGRRGYVNWEHSARDEAAPVRDFTKWDDIPMSLPSFAESMVRAYTIAMTPPLMPVVLVVDTKLQEKPAGQGLRIPKLTVPSPPQGDSEAVEEVARRLAAADYPVIVTGRSARTPEGLKRLIELAETLQAGVIDQYFRMNFPTRHPLNQFRNARAALANADVILGLEVEDLYGTLNSYDARTDTNVPLTKPDAKILNITCNDLYIKSNYQEFQRYPDADLSIAADSEATMPALIDAVNRLITSGRKQTFQDRGTKITEVTRRDLERDRTEATYGWNASPISTARVSAELWAQIKDEDWSLVNDVVFFGRWPLRLWDMNKHYQYIGGRGGEGMGYGMPGTVGAALANKKYGRLTVNIQGDGDMMYNIGTLWSAAHHRVPLLTIMHNNRAYHNETMAIQRLSNVHNRGIDSCKIGTALDDPNIDYAKVAQGMGVYAEGPISDPNELGPALRRAIDVVKKGQPALIDVITQPR